MRLRGVVTLFVVDWLLMLVATFIAFVLRENLEPSFARLIAHAPYFAATAIAAAFIMPSIGLNRTIWRLSAMPDYLAIVIATSAIVAATVGLVFAYNRLDGVGRALPFLHWMVAVVALVGARVLFRLRHNQRSARKVTHLPLNIKTEPTEEVVLLVGLSRLTEAYLQSIDELSNGGLRVAGILGQRERHVGRLVANHSVLGLPEDVEAVINDLELHGVVLNRIVVTTAFNRLSPEARAALLAIERGRSIELQLLAEDLGLVSRHARSGGPDMSKALDSDRLLRVTLDPSEIEQIRRRPYWVLKRGIDVVASAILLTLLAPVLVIVAICVAMSIGFPVAFWQQRPGLGGRPFRIYKFRTMAAAHDVDGRRLTDAERTSKVCNLLRATRLDELPQLVNILRGDMSFVGPRPLLPRDQSDAFNARLLLRPGLTGWAQVAGGRAISAEDKAVLDIWYVGHASLLLDLEIIARTVPMVLFGERTSKKLIELAWRDLCAAGVLQGDLADACSARFRQAA